MAGACGKSVGTSFARDKPAGAFVVSSKMLVGLVEYWESGRMRELQTDVRRDGQTGKINTMISVALASLMETVLVLPLFSLARPKIWLCAGNR
jgi:hypothetical protein